MLGSKALARGGSRLSRKRNIPGTVGNNGVQERRGWASVGLVSAGSPLGDQLLVADQLVAGLLIGLAAVDLLQITEAKLHGGEHGIVVVHGVPNGEHRPREERPGSDR